MIEAEAKFVDQVVAEGVELAGSEALGGVVAVAILKAAAVENVIEGRGKEVAVVAVTEAGEKIILCADGLVDANIELVFSFAAFGIGQVVAGGEQSADIDIGRGKQIGQFLGRADR